MQLKFIDSSVDTICIRCGEKVPKDSVVPDNICAKCKEARKTNGHKKTKKKIEV
jgi:hypothetical protein